MRRLLLTVVLALSVAACQSVPAGTTAMPLPIGPEFVTAADKLPELPFGLVLLKPAPDSPASVDTWRNRAFCEQYLRTPPPGGSTSVDAKVRPIHTVWLITDGPSAPTDCTQMLQRYDLARSAAITGKVRFVAEGPKGEGPYLAMIGDEEAVLVDGSSFSDFGPLLASWNADVAATQQKFAENGAGVSAGKIASAILKILLILLIMAGTPAGA